MKTDICKLSSDKETFNAIFAEVEKSAEYNNLSKKQALQLRLLAEELAGMLPELLEVGGGEFWIENTGNDFELHASIKSGRLSYFEKENVLSVSKSGKNAAAKGIISKIKIVAEDMLSGYVEASKVSGNSGGYYDFYDMGSSAGFAYDNAWSSAWSLSSYREYAGEDKNSEAWDELEKSIIANLADDVLVGVIGKKVEIIIKKKFA